MEIRGKSSRIWSSDVFKYQSLPSGKLTQLYGKPPFLMAKSTISMAIFNSKLLVYQRVLLIVGGYIYIYIINNILIYPPTINMNHPILILILLLMI